MGEIFSSGLRGPRRWSRKITVTDEVEFAGDEGGGNGNWRSREEEFDSTGRSYDSYLQPAKNRRLRGSSISPNVSGVKDVNPVNQFDHIVRYDSLAIGSNFSEMAVDIKLDALIEQMAFGEELPSNPPSIVRKKIEFEL